MRRDHTGSTERPNQIRPLFLCSYDYEPHIQLDASLPLLPLNLRLNQSSQNRREIQRIKISLSLSLAVEEQLAGRHMIQGMLGSSLASPLLPYDSAIRVTLSTHSFLQTRITIQAPNRSIPEAKSSVPLFSNLTQGILRLNQPPAKKWAVFSAAAETYNLTEEESKSWESCRAALKPFGFSSEEEDKLLAKAFGQLQSPYWSEDRNREIPRPSSVSETLDYLKSLDLSDDDLSKLLKKFPEVLGCSLEDEVKNNVQVLERVWGIEGKSLKNLLKRNPKVLGYSVDCKGDCVAKCTRCWVRF